MWESRLSYNSVRLCIFGITDNRHTASVGVSRRLAKQEKKVYISARRTGAFVLPFYVTLDRVFTLSTPRSAIETSTGRPVTVDQKQSMYSAPVSLQSLTPDSLRTWVFRANDMPGHIQQLIGSVFYIAVR